MADIVANHVGPVHLNYTSIVPFNNNDSYHDFCEINSGDF